VSGDRLRGHPIRTPYWFRETVYLVAAATIGLGGLAGALRLDALVAVVQSAGCLLVSAGILFALVRRSLHGRLGTDGSMFDSDYDRIARLDPPGALPMLRTVLAWSGALGALAAPWLFLRGSASARWTLLASAAALVTSFALGRRGKARGRVVICGSARGQVGARVRVGIDVATSNPTARFERLSCTLQCVSERPIWGGVLPPEHRRLFASTVEHADDFGPGRLGLELEFDVPAGLPATDFRARPAVYWELAVEGEGAGFRYEDVFLVPVDGRAA
jgi:hypothetical protein